jgi:hypothetical protein
LQQRNQQTPSVQYFDTSSLDPENPTTPYCQVALYKRVVNTDSQELLKGVRNQLSSLKKTPLLRLLTAFHRANNLEA